METSFSIGGAMFDPSRTMICTAPTGGQTPALRAKTREPQPGGKPDAGVTNKKQGPW